ncbi:phosphoglucomutase/phosphomannomutase family protein [soil metagenome]
MSDIKFGTDGWRAVIGDGYTFANVERVARATAQWLIDENEEPSIVLGYDTRFQGETFARRVAEVMGTMGVSVRMADSFVTTPAISWAAGRYNHSAGVVITASHNPPEYNGFKIKAGFGGPATQEMIAEVEQRLATLGDGFDRKDFDSLVDAGRITTHNLAEDYRNVLADGIDVGAIKRSGTRIAYDAMYGAGQGYVGDLIGRRQVVELHHDHNPGMKGQAPEPIERNLERLSRAVIEERCEVGMATDGDADRIGMFDEKGRFVDSHQLLALLVKYLHEERSLTGTIVKTFSTTDMLERMAKQYGLPIETTPIGFKYIVPYLIDGDVLVAGEESGGMAIKGHIPERDGLFIGLTIVEMMVKRGKPLSALVQELFDEFGEHRTYRTDLHTTQLRKETVLERLSNEGLSQIDGREVTSTETLDGFKYRVDGGWLMFRASGTEPVLRIYSEARSLDEARDLVRAGMQFVADA